jgi:GTP pyrophosphokinase
LGMRSRSNIKTQIADIDIDMEIYNIESLNRMLSKINQMNDVVSAKRL